MTALPTLRRAAALLAGAVTAAFLTGCAATPSPDASSTSPENQEREIATLHTSKCGACHAAPAPKTRTREHLEEAFTRHKRRVHLTGEEWAELTDYLAMPEGRTARQP